MTDDKYEKMMKSIEARLFGPDYKPPKPSLTNEERFKKFRAWWKLDDPEWVKQRKEEWRHMRSTSMKNWSAKELKYTGKFYLTGEEPPPVTQGGGRIYSEMRLTLTPFTTVEEARELYFTITARERDKNKINTFLGNILKHGNGFSWVRPKIKACAEVMFGHEYRKIEEPESETNAHLVQTSPDPTEFSSSFCNSALLVLNKNREYYDCIVLVDYFVSALAYADWPAQRSNIKIDKLFQAIDTVLADPENHSDLANELAGKLKAKESQILENWSLHSHLDQ
jgi:hypothetical protein